jgi:hypothetical protein
MTNQLVLDTEFIGLLLEPELLLGDYYGTLRIS